MSPERDDFDEETIDTVFTVRPARRMVCVLLLLKEAKNPQEAVRFQVDCGASVNVVPAEAVPRAVINRTKRPRLRMYNGAVLHSIGTTRVSAANQKTGAPCVLDCVVVRGNLQPIIGRQSAEELGLISFDYEQVDSVGAERRQRPSEDREQPEGHAGLSRQDIYRRYSEVFTHGLGTSREWCGWP